MDVLRQEFFNRPPTKLPLSLSRQHAQNLVRLDRAVPPHSSQFRACSESQKYQSIGPSRSLNMSFIAARLQHQWHQEHVSRRYGRARNCRKLLLCLHRVLCGIVILIKWGLVRDKPPILIPRSVVHFAVVHIVLTPCLIAFCSSCSPTTGQRLF